MLLWQSNDSRLYQVEDKAQNIAQRPFDAISFASRPVSRLNARIGIHWVLTSLGKTPYRISPTPWLLLVHVEPVARLPLHATCCHGDQAYQNVTVPMFTSSTTVSVQVCIITWNTHAL